jgi:diacylglycerol kinase (ATP)
MNPNDNDVRAAVLSFRHAWNGIAYMLRTQRNAWIHACATLAVCVAGIGLHISAADWRWIVLGITLVWAAETLNTAIEFVCDVVSPEYHPAVKNAKDIGAGAVLICAFGAAILGVLTLAPYLWSI